MDPNETLRMLRSTSKKLLDALDRKPGGTQNPITDDDIDAARVCELFIGLDDWISRGGFLPSSWSQKENK